MAVLYLRKKYVYFTNPIASLQSMYSVRSICPRRPEFPTSLFDTGGAGNPLYLSSDTFCAFLPENWGYYARSKFLPSQMLRALMYFSFHFPLKTAVSFQPQSYRALSMGQAVSRPWGSSGPEFYLSRQSFSVVTNTSTNNSLEQIACARSPHGVSFMTNLAHWHVDCKVSRCTSK